MYAHNCDTPGAREGLAARVRVISTHHSTSTTVIRSFPLLLVVPVLLRSSRPHPRARPYLALVTAARPATGRGLLVLDRPILLVVALLLLTVRRRRTVPPVAACASVCSNGAPSASTAQHGVPYATAALDLALDLGGAHTTPHHDAHDSALARETAP